MPKHIILICTGLVLGIMANWWIQPDTAAGSTTLIVLAVLLSEGIGALVTLLLRLAFRMRHHGDPPPQSPAKLLAAGLVVVAALHGPARAQSPADPPAPGPTGMVTVLNAAEQALTGVFITKPAGRRTRSQSAGRLGPRVRPAAPIRDRYVTWLWRKRQRRVRQRRGHRGAGRRPLHAPDARVTGAKGARTPRPLVRLPPLSDPAPVGATQAAKTCAAAIGNKGDSVSLHPHPPAAPQAPAPRAELAARAPVTLAAPPAAAFAPLASLLAAPPAVALAAPPLPPHSCKRRPRLRRQRRPGPPRIFTRRVCSWPGPTSRQPASARMASSPSRALPHLPTPPG